MVKRTAVRRPRRKPLLLSATIKNPKGLNTVAFEPALPSEDLALDGIIMDEETGEAERVPAPKTKGDVIEVQPIKWATNRRMWWAAAETDDLLPAGLYTCGMNDNSGPYFLKHLVQTDELFSLPDSKTAQVVAEVKKFWTLKDTYKKFGFLHKRGLLLYGPPGSGKTSTIQQLIQVIIKDYKGIGIYIEGPMLASMCLQLIRKIEPERPIIAIIEDIDAHITHHGISQYLSLLDGEAQVDNIVFIGTTNYIKQLDPRLTNRPARFDECILIDLPTPEARRAYISHRIKDFAKEEISDDELDRWVSLTADLSIAHLRELIAAVKCLGHDLEAKATALQEMSTPQDINESRDFGFVKK